VNQAWLSQQKRGGVRGQPFIAVPNTLDALQALARYHRRRLGIPVIGITGTNGKTTTKEMIASVLGTRHRVLRSESSFNNHIGVPLTLLRLRRAHEVAVVELGMNHPGEISELCTIAVPTSGVITNVGLAHLEYMRDLDSIARAKGELAEAIGRGGFLVLNADDNRVFALGTQTEARVIYFGFGDRAQIKGKLLEPIDGALWSFRYGSSPPIQLRVAGAHNVANALAAAAVGEAMGCSDEQIKEGLESYRGTRMRSELIEIDNILIVNDAYNANPVSASRALELLRDWKNGRPHRRIAVLGDMLELGEFSPDAHRELGQNAYANGIDLLISVGAYSSELADGAIEAGMKAERVHPCREVGEAGKILSTLLQSGDLVLLKGSRRIGLDALVALIRETIPGGGEEA
jgi:UDP-N-acetylmuramoyl-tripeptide--D-alanyl-D-alanine ligase